MFLDFFFMFLQIFKRKFERIPCERHHRSVVFKTGKIGMKMLNHPVEVVNSLTLNTVASTARLTCLIQCGKRRSIPTSLYFLISSV